MSEVIQPVESVIISCASLSHVPSTSLSLTTTVGFVFVVEHYRKSLDRVLSNLRSLHTYAFPLSLAIFVTAHFYEILICCQFHHFEKQDEKYHDISSTRQNAPSNVRIWVVAYTHCVLPPEGDRLLVGRYILVVHGSLVAFFANGGRWNDAKEIFVERSLKDRSPLHELFNTIPHRMSDP